MQKLLITAEIWYPKEPKVKEN